MALTTMVKYTNTNVSLESNSQWTYNLKVQMTAYNSRNNRLRAKMRTSSKTRMLNSKEESRYSTVSTRNQKQIR